MTNLFGVKILMNPWVVLPLLILATVIVASLISAVTLWVLGKIVQRSPGEWDQRIYRLLKSYLFPLLVVGGLLFMIDEIPPPAKVLRAADRLLVLSGLVLFDISFNQGGIAYSPQRWSPL